MLFKGMRNDSEDHSRLTNATVGMEWQALRFANASDKKHSSLNAHFTKEYYVEGDGYFQKANSEEGRVELFITLF